MRPAGSVMLAAALVLSGLTACSASPPPAPRPSATATAAAATPTPTPTPTPVVPSWTSFIATAPGSVVDVFAEPGGDAPTGTVSAADALSLPDSIPLTFLVLEQVDGWVEVLLPAAPVGSTGWVRAADVTVSTTDLRLELRLTEHRLLLHRADRVVLDVGVGLGSDPLPVPGRYFVTELLQPPGSVSGPGSVHGSFVYGLSGYPPLLESFAAGHGITGIHGTGDPAGLGPDGTPGSVRILDPDVTRLVQEFGLPLGTPVDVLA